VLTAAESPPDERAAFLRRTAARLACAAVAFLAVECVALFVLKAEVIRAWMCDSPLALLLLVASLVAAWLARDWTETEHPHPLTVLVLHTAAQSLLLAPLLSVVVGWLGAWALLLAVFALVVILADVARILHYFRADQPDSAALRSARLGGAGAVGRCRESGVGFCPVAASACDQPRLTTTGAHR
jgi:FtsH-binding integral membrane protein